MLELCNNESAWERNLKFPLSPHGEVPPTRLWLWNSHFIPPVSFPFSHQHITRQIVSVRRPMKKKGEEELGSITVHSSLCASRSEKKTWKRHTKLMLWEKRNNNIHNVRTQLNIEWTVINQEKWFSHLHSVNSLSLLTLIIRLFSRAALSAMAARGESEWNTQTVLYCYAISLRPHFLFLSLFLFPKPFTIADKRDESDSPPTLTIFFHTVSLSFVRYMKSIFMPLRVSSLHPLSASNRTYCVSGGTLGHKSSSSWVPYIFHIIWMRRRRLRFRRFRVAEIDCRALELIHTRDQNLNL